jgi:hypothetical protein
MDMSTTNTMLDQAQAELSAGRKAEAWRLTAQVVKAEPQNARAWRVLAAISEQDAPERAAGYRAKAEAAETAARFNPSAVTGSTHYLPHQPPPMQQPQPMPLRPSAPAQYQQAVQFAPQSVRATPVKKRRSPLLRIIIAMLILAVLATVVIFVLERYQPAPAPSESPAGAVHSSVTLR